MVSTQSGHRSLKKTKGMSSFRKAQSGEADFGAYYDYNNGSNDCNVRGSAGRQAGINNTAEDAPFFYYTTIKMSLTVAIKHFTVEFSIIHVFHNCFYEPCFILVPAVFFKLSCAYTGSFCEARLILWKEFNLFNEPSPKLCLCAHEL